MGSGEEALADDLGIGRVGLVVEHGLGIADERGGEGVWDLGAEGSLLGGALLVAAVLPQ